MTPNRKTLSTELKDLDVDRVDGVDRPATGRAFIVSKSAFRLFPSEAVQKRDERATIVDLRKQIDGLVLQVEKTWIARYVRECVTKAGQSLGFILKDDHGDETPIMKRSEAEALALKILRAEHPDIYDSNRINGRPSGMGGAAMDSTHPGERMNTAMTTSFLDPAGTARDQTSDLLDGPTDHLGHPRNPPKRKSLTEIHQASMKQRGRSNTPGRKAFIN